MIKFNHLYTGRLMLRKLNVQDKEAVFAYRKLPNVYRYQSFQPKTMSDADDFFQRLAPEIGIPGSWFQLAICLNEKLIGDLGIHFLNHEEAEIGYTLSPEFQGFGYASEAVQTVTGYLFNNLGVKSIRAEADIENVKSIRLLKKLHMDQSEENGYFIFTLKNPKEEKNENHNAD